MKWLKIYKNKWQEREGEGERGEGEEKRKREGEGRGRGGGGRREGEKDEVRRYILSRDALPRVSRNERGDVVHPLVDDDPTILSTAVLFDLLSC